MPEWSLDKVLFSYIWKDLTTFSISFSILFLFECNIELIFFKPYNIIGSRTYGVNGQASFK